MMKVLRKGIKMTGSLKLKYKYYFTDNNEQNLCREIGKFYLTTCKFYEKNQNRWDYLGLCEIN